MSIATDFSSPSALLPPSRLTSSLRRTTFSIASPPTIADLRHVAADTRAHRFSPRSARLSSAGTLEPPETASRKRNADVGREGERGSGNIDEFEAKSVLALRERTDLLLTAASAADFNEILTGDFHPFRDTELRARAVSPVFGETLIERWGRSRKYLTRSSFVGCRPCPRGMET